MLHPTSMIQRRVRISTAPADSRYPDCLSPGLQPLGEKKRKNGGEATADKANSFLRDKGLAV